MDSFDQKIVQELQRNGRITNAELAEKIGLSQSACLRRTKNLEHSGVIRGYSAIVTKPADDTPLMFVQITLDKQSRENFLRFDEKVRKCSSVLGCYLVTGPFDYLLILRPNDFADFNEIFHQELSALPDVARRISYSVVRTVVGGRDLVS
ncbi:Lrp/AsnC family transcriptional regulator [Celeribacter indicus]|uniref:Leucine-responsive regulatory protein n=1 Tax=Celeribacter indicus TaxID=1208324 RepID=A0A0B5E822_9RHOB|nr:Lrp/AsnC family transcriptional regulator [Celeribacter indicus]AJE48462.1 Leucine-responsive regulatory protein [Celeribacter indicus]SDX28781.1 DNA-binding transcriptional regulator, Lrp family [Celeribacter indicus]